MSKKCGWLRWRGWQWRHENDGAHWNAAGPFSLSVFFFFGDRRQQNDRDLAQRLASHADTAAPPPGSIEEMMANIGKTLK